ncbi:hypothetical protein PMM47T1_14331 [Pseudomonas sp. M47T1]|uniref:lipopolysaccharide core heptose(II)-phosphate phosphatase PmrG n=1 Tax=unclassified Pseudomonas TaxID=196821 RepID=UPI00026089A9|nr:histidine phosphatase family protein [Pseudomonas sp. M47T1]EIK95842.1 hypothetical protein PMM47T1_14331 [Pseudomonas sp. M47T1]
MTVPVRRPPLSLLKKVLIGTAALVLPALIAGFVVWPRSPLDLGDGVNLGKSGMREHWAQGDVIVVVRHVERCDRSDATCLTEADGITHDGSQMATRIGEGFKALGMGNTDVMTSPATRTVQTGQFMFGTASQPQQWLWNCDKATLLQDAMAHKQPHRNLVLVAHSDCISKLEAQLDYEHAAASEYGTAFFIRVHRHAKPSSLGLMNPEGWETALKGNTL